MAYKIFANHAHVFEKAYREAGTVDSLKQYMDECGIEKAVAYPPILRTRGEPVPMTDPGMDQNLWLAGELKGAADIVAFGTINFMRDDLREQTEQIAGLGFKGIKLHPAAQQFNVAGPRAYKIYQEAEKLGLFLSFHTGVHWHRIKDYSMLLFDEVAYDFPKLRFSMEHLGGYCFFREGLAVMANSQKDKENPRAFAGWTSIFEKGLWYLSDEELKDLIFITGENAHIFGLDFPYNSVEKTKRAIERISSMDIPESAKAKIFGENLHRAIKTQWQGV